MSPIGAILFSDRKRHFSPFKHFLNFIMWRLMNNMDWTFFSNFQIKRLHFGSKVIKIIVKWSKSSEKLEKVIREFICCKSHNFQIVTIKKENNFLSYFFIMRLMYYIKNILQKSTIWWNIYNENAVVDISYMRT